MNPRRILTNDGSGVTLNVEEAGGNKPVTPSEGLVQRVTHRMRRRLATNHEVQKNDHEVQEETTIPLLVVGGTCVSCSCPFRDEDAVLSRGQSSGSSGRGSLPPTASCASLRQRSFQGPNGGRPAPRGAGWRKPAEKEAR